MIPDDALNKIRSATIHYNPGTCIYGFSFFDKDGIKLWGIGLTNLSYLKMETVVLAKNEVIVGVVARLYSGHQSMYTDFQFQIALE